MSTAQRKSLLTLKTSIYEKWLPIWRRNETRTIGGDSVVDEALKAFQWEKMQTEKNGSSSTHFDDRKELAVYINFPARVAQVMVGSIERKAPKPDEGITFGSMGKVSEKNSIAHAVFNSFDDRLGGGVDMISFFTDAQKMAMATGHRWIFAESYPKQPGIKGAPTAAQVADLKLYPYAIEFSPIDVPFWYYDDSGLAYIGFKIKEVETVVDENGVSFKEKEKIYFHVRKGFDIFDQMSKDMPYLFSAGSFTLINEDGTIDEARSGTYESTGGMIPAVPFFYEESTGTPDLPAISRPGLSEVCRLAGSYLNLSSAGDNDALESGSRLLFLLGVGKDQHNEVVGQLALGGRVISVPKEDPEADSPTIVDIAATTAHAAIEARLSRRLIEMESLASDETRVAPAASGVARDNQFRDSKSPRLSMMARNRASAETAILKFMEMRATGVKQPTALSSWPKEFDLRPVLDGLRDVIMIVADSGASSPTLTGLVVERSLREVGLAEETGANSDLIQKIVDEVRASIEASIRRTDFLTNEVPTPTVDNTAAGDPNVDNAGGGN